ncbi:Zinc finger and BTB domain-containing protein 49 [Pseudolycoriella hygida]|uniref:Zinc finger and BTB domain-containing protein 49 n=1 Tax=Pseudolycoriella hygida TaxID=35572 RepID=A0A9Q0MLT2_9DIPT|nr:Zinc finger and BTB domain-containing protein 49 [Pseudolycoriella hygida]
MDYNININKICRVCLEEGVLTSIFNMEFAMMPADMIMLCAKVKVYKNDGLPSVICNNCIYRLGAAYHFKQQCENSDLRLRSYLGILDKGFGTRDNETNTDNPIEQVARKTEEDDDEEKKKISKRTRSRYKRKLPEERKKRGPKPNPAKVPQTCYECHKTFKCAAQLQLHIRTHSGERPYVCSYCSRRFAQKHNLTIHIRTHTNERPFQCEICSKQFAALGNFQAHKKIHSGVRDQICPICNKGFITSGDVARHMVVHTGIKNHPCDTCGKTFSRNRDMVAHKKKIHLNERTTETYKCRECHKVFATSLSLIEHYRTHEPSVSMPIAPTAINGSLGTVGLGILPPPMLGHSHQSSLGMMHHTQRLHPF